LSPARRRFFAAIAGLVAVALAVAIVAFVRTREPPVEPVSQDVPGPVLLVPGYGGSTASLKVLATALEENGREAEVVPLAGDGTGDLREQAQVLGAAVDEVRERTGSASVDIVGYSAGGVVARLWVAELGGGDVARRVLTLGSPHHGTDVAGLAADVAPDACPTACRQLASDSDLLRRLNAGDETPDGPLWVSVWTRDDVIVVPPETAELEGALNFSVQSVCGDVRVEHGDLPRDPMVVALAIDQLRQALPSRPTPAAC
jgi:triacylglycerol esterase/lipase EstA (alpha/beta hydrolase family)